MGKTFVIKPMWGGNVLRSKRVFAVTLALIIFIQLGGNVFAEEKTGFSVHEISDEINEIISHISKDRSQEYTEWQIIGMKAAEIEIPAKSYEYLEEYLRENEGNFRKITDYAKLAMAVAALDRNPRNVAGYDVLEKIYNNTNMTLQGTNGPIFALIALDACNVQVPNDALWTKEKLLQYILNQQNPDGGFSLVYGETSDIDLTAMAIQALSRYQERPEVKTVIEKAIEFLSEKQSSDGGFTAWGDSSSESISQVIVALTALKIDPLKDSRFIKDGNLISKLFSFKEAGGGYSHIEGQGTDEMATEQALVALAAYKRFLEGKSWIYNIAITEEKTTDLNTNPSFEDISSASEWARQYIEKAKKYGLMEGKGQNRFEPKQNITRAEFAALLGRLLKLEGKSNGIPVFIDVQPDNWFYGYVMSCYEKGIINGKTQDKFLPHDYITREEMAVMFQRALSLDTIEDVKLKDLQDASPWAVPAIKAVVGNELMTGADGVFSPKQRVTREMAATVIVRVFERGEIK